MIFKLKRIPEKDTLLGYEWIEVLYATPFRMAEQTWKPPMPDEKTIYVISNNYVCRTNKGLCRIGESDLFAALNEEGGYVEVDEEE